MGKTYDPAEVRSVADAVEAANPRIPKGTLHKLVAIESSYGQNPNDSETGAQGPLQFLPSTRKLPLFQGFTDPYDLRASMENAAKYINYGLDRYDGDIISAIADYKGGPKQVAALAKGKADPATMKYLAMFKGEAPIPLPDGAAAEFRSAVPDAAVGSTLSRGVSSFKYTDPRLNPSGSDLQLQQQQRDAAHGGLVNGIVDTGRAAAITFDNTNPIYNYFVTKGLDQVGEQSPLTKEAIQAATAGIPPEHWDYVLGGASVGAINARRARVLSGLQNEAELAQMGLGAKLAGGALAGIVDPITIASLAAGAVTAGGAPLLMTTSRLLNAARAGAIGAAANVASDVASAPYRPLSGADNLYLSATLGLAMGGIGGALVNPAAVAAAREAAASRGLAAENQALARWGYSRFSDEARAAVEGLGAENAAIRGGRQQFLNNLEAGLRKDVHSNIPDAAVISKFNDIDIAAGKAERGVISNTLQDERIQGGTSAKGAENDAAIIGKIKDETKDIPVFKKPTGDIYNNQKGKGPDSSVSKLLVELKTSSDPMVSKLAAHLETQLRDDVPVKMRDSTYRSNYDTIGNMINLRHDAEDWVKLHEVAHAVTAQKIRYGLANPKTAHGELVKQLNDVFLDAKVAASKTKLADYKSHYYLKNMDEFVAGLFSGKSEFIDFLRNTKTTDNRTFLSKAVEIVRRILGIGQDEANLLTKSFGIVDEMLANPLQVQQTARGTGGKVFKLDYLQEPLKEERLVPAAPGVEAATADAANKAHIPTVFGWGLGLENKLGGAKAPSGVRALASKLFGTTVGYKGNSVVAQNAWDTTMQLAEGWIAKTRKEAYAAFDEWSKERGVKAFQKGQAFDQFGEEVSNYIRGVDGEYAPQVKRAGEAIRKTLGDVVDHINNPSQFTGGKKMGLTETKIINPETGAESIVGTLEKNPNYLPRKHDINKWNNLVNNFGRDAVEGWWARAYQSAREGITDEAAQKWSKWYVKALEDAQVDRSQDLLENMLRGQDREALVQSLIHKGGYDESAARKLVEDMLPVKPTDSGAMNSSLKHRNTINERYTEKWTNKDGEEVEIGLNDFVNSNALDVIDPYLRKTAANVALAHHLDVYKAGDVDRLIADATRNELGSAMLQKHELEDMRKNLRFAFDRILGLPMEEFSTVNKALEMWRNFNVIRLMGGTVWNQAVELGQIVGTMGWKATLAAVPELRALSRDLKTGKVANEILDHLENTIGGAGAEYIQRMEFKGSDDWVRYKGDTKFNRFLDSVDTGLKKVAKGTLDYTGMTPLMIQQKRVHAVALVNHFINVAHGKVEAGFLNEARLAWMGMSGEDFTALKAALVQHTKPAKGRYGESFKLDFKAFVEQNPELHSKFMTAIHRESRRVVQENDLASMIPIMGTTLGKTVFQFQNFTFQGWNKSLMFAMNHRDWATMATVLHSSFLASLAYMGRTALQSQGMSPEKQQKFLEQRMAVGQIVANSFGRISQVSLLPNLYDTASPWPIFQGMRTTSDLSSLAANPTLQGVNALLSLKKLARNGLSDQYQTTEKDMRSWFRLLPLNNVYPMSTILNSIANDYPYSEKQQ